MSLSQNFRKANAVARAILAGAEAMASDMENAETEDDLFSVKTRTENIARLMAKLNAINVASLEGRTYEDE